MRNSRESRAILILGSLVTIVLFSGDRNSQNHNKRMSFLKSKTPFCASRGISSVSSSSENELQKNCQNFSRIKVLHEKVAELENQTGELVKVYNAALEEEKSRERKVEEKKNKSLMQMAYLPYNPYSETLLQKAWLQYHQTPSIVSTYNPFHDHSMNKNMNYLKIAMGQRLAQKLNSANSWSPEWNSQGHLTNSPYGGPNAWQELENMHRLPLSTGFSLQSQGYPQYPSFPLY